MFTQNIVQCSVSCPEVIFDSRIVFAILSSLFEAKTWRASAYCVIVTLELIAVQRSFIYKLNRRGTNTIPWVTSLTTFIQFD